MSINGGMDKDVVCVYTYIYIYNGLLLLIKNNEPVPFVVTWMDLEMIILSEVSQTVKDKYHMILSTCGI